MAGPGPADRCPRCPVDDQAGRGGRLAPGSRAANRSSSSSASAGLAALQQGGGQGAAQLPHDRGRGRALADDVADGDGHAVVVQLDHVVPVAAGLGALRAGQVAGGEGEPRRAAGSRWGSRLRCSVSAIRCSAR